MREIVHLQVGQCGNQIGAKVFSSPLSMFLAEFNRSSGKFSHTNTRSAPMAALMKLFPTSTCAWSALRSTIRRRRMDATCREQSWSIWSRALWTRSKRPLLDSSFDRTISSLVLLRNARAKSQSILRPIGCRQQLGERTLHRGRRAYRSSAGCSEA